MEDKHLDL